MQSPPPDPKEMIAKLLRGETQVQLAARLSVTRQALNMVLTGSRNISPGLALKLGELSGDGPDYWLRLQREWNLWCATPVGQEREQEKERVSLLDQWHARGPRILFDSDIREAMSAGLIKISGFKPENLKKASYDLTIGMPQLMDVDSEESVVEDKKRQHYILPPNELLCARANEVVELSEHIIARLGPTTDLINSGILAHFGLQIDPGYKGVICFALENRLKKRVPLGKDEPCISLEFHFSSRTPTLKGDERAGSPDGAFSQFQPPVLNGRHPAN